MTRRRNVGLTYSRQSCGTAPPSNGVHRYSIVAAHATRFHGNYRSFPGFVSSVMDLGSSSPRLQAGVNFVSAHALTWRLVWWFCVSLDAGRSCKQYSNCELQDDCRSSLIAILMLLTQVSSLLQLVWSIASEWYHPFAITLLGLHLLEVKRIPVYVLPFYFL